VISRRVSFPSSTSSTLLSTCPATLTVHLPQHADEHRPQVNTAGLPVSRRNRRAGGRLRSTVPAERASEPRCRRFFADDQPYYCDGAAALGIRTFRIDRAGRISPPTSTSSIRGLHQLLELV